MKEEIVEKAWVINNSNWEEPYFCPQDVFYAETAGKAKLKALKHIDCGDALDSSGNELTFTTIKVQRANELDKILFEGVPTERHQIDYVLEKRERDNELLKLAKENAGAYAYIKKGGYYYRDNHSGYTEYILQAGVYPIQEAVRSVMHLSLGDNGRVILINPDEHNKMIETEIAKLQGKIIF